ncbi:MAG: type II secretion system GspH family protein [Synergistaceae bacterium]|jgi:type II secretory pathway pseudopilin PulG|nr:type II secretion system GspH family protein [Synergistaceae bacterium]
MAVDIAKRRHRGFSLTEVLTILCIISILAGMTLLVMGGNTNNAEATVILGELDSAKSAMLAYSMEHRTRTSDQLGGWDGATPSVIKASLDKYLDSKVNMSGNKATQRFGKLGVRYSGSAIEIGFVGFDADAGMRRAIERKVTAAQGFSGVPDAGANKYTLWLRVR